MKSLAWTLLRPHTKGFYGNVLLGITPPGAILRIWDAFQRLTGVRTLDLAWLSSDHGNPFADGYANGLRHVTLACCPECWHHLLAGGRIRYSGFEAEIH